MNRLTTVSLLTCLITGASAWGQDPNHTIYFGQSVSSSSLVEVRTLLDNSNGVGIGAWSYGVCHVVSSLNILDATAGSGTATVSSGGLADFHAIQVHPDGVTQGVVTDLGHCGCSGHVDPTPAFEMMLITYELAGDTNFDIAYCDTIGTPPAALTLQQHGSGTVIFPTVLSHTVDFSNSFQRGLCNGDATLDVADPIALASSLFGGGGDIACLDSCDANDDGQVDVADIVTLLTWLFADGLDLPAPHLECGWDPTPDSLTCDTPPCM